MSKKLEGEIKDLLEMDFELKDVIDALGEEYDEEEITKSYNKLSFKEVKSSPKVKKQPSFTEVKKTSFKTLSDQELTKVMVQKKLELDFKASKNEVSESSLKETAFLFQNFGDSSIYNLEQVTNCYHSADFFFLYLMELRYEPSKVLDLMKQHYNSKFTQDQLENLKQKVKNEYPNEYSEYFKIVKIRKYLEEKDNPKTDSPSSKEKEKSFDSPSKKLYKGTKTKVDFDVSKLSTTSS